MGRSKRAMAAKRTERTDLNPTLKQAQRSERWRDWLEAIDKEMSMLQRMDSYEPILKAQVPRHCQILQSKMDLKTKVTSTDSVDKLKARLVALGNLE